MKPVLQPNQKTIAASLRQHDGGEPASQAPPPADRPQQIPQISSKYIGYAAGAIAVAAVLAWAFRPVPLLVDLGPVDRGTIQVTVNAEAKTRVRDRFTIAAPVSGQLNRIALKEGDEVAAGSSIASIDPLPVNADIQKALGQLAEWRAQRVGVATQRPKAATIEQTRTRILQAEANHRQAEAKVAQAKAALEQARRDRERSQQLQASGAIARKDVEVAILNEITRAKDLEAANLGVKVAISEVEVARAALKVKQQEQTDPDYLLKVYDARIASTEADLLKLRDLAKRTEIRSPSQGRVLKILQQSAQFINQGTPLLELGNVANLELVIDVLSSDAERLQAGNPILVERLNAPPLRAQVRKIEPSAFTKVSALGVEEQRVNAIGDFIGSPQGLGDGYRLDTKIVVWQGQNLVKVPLSALFRCERAWCVFTAEGGKAKRRSIAVGHRSDLEAEIPQGLTPGEKVILHPSEQIDDGSPIRSR